MSLINRLSSGDSLHREACEALELFGAFAEFVLHDDERTRDFVIWCKAMSSNRAGDRAGFREALDLLSSRRI